MEKEIPYFKQPDDSHCFQACLKMILKYFFPERDFTYEELETISDKPENKWTWLCAVSVKLKNMGLKVKHYSVFDYNDFVKSGEDYIRKTYEKSIAEKMIRLTDIKSEVENSDRMLKENVFELKEVSLRDVENWFKDGYTAIFLINCSIINKESGYEGHYVVLTGFDDENVFINDPDRWKGSPNRKVEKDLFVKAWSFPEKENTVILIKK